MTSNHLVTGPPRSGKTTVIQRTLDQLDQLGVTAGGFYSPEIREDGERVGFELVEVRGEERAMLAHVDQQGRARVGKYSVAVEAVDEFAERALSASRANADLVVIDEIAPMQLHSEMFIAELERTLDSEIPVLAAIQFQSSFPFVEDLKQRQDARLYKVTRATRETLPNRLATRLQSSVE